jgi:site-specific recombinase XerD
MVSGDESCRDVTAKDIRNALENRKKTPALANNFLKALKGLFKWAVLNEHIDLDPTSGVQGLRAKTTGFPLWTPDDVSRFCEKWEIGTMPRVDRPLRHPEIGHPSRRPAAPLW